MSIRSAFRSSKGYRYEKRGKSTTKESQSVFSRFYRRSRH